LERDASKRWQSAQDMLSMLKYGGVAPPSPDASATQTIVAPSTRFSRPKRRTPVVIALVVALLAGGGYTAYRLRPAPAAPGGPVARMKGQVAILPFEADTETSRSAADGLFEVLSGALAEAGRAQGLELISPGELAKREVSTPEKAHQMYGADRAIAGSAAASGDKVELKFRLIDTASKKVLAERSAIYDPKDPVVSRDQAVAQVAGMLNLDVHNAPATGTDSGAASAYSAYIEGRGFMARYDLPGNIDRAIASFSSAVKQDSRYALAYAGLGEAYWRKAVSKGDKQAATLANQNAEFAVSIDPKLAIGHSVLGSVYLDAGRRDDAVREFQKALDLAPDNPDASRKLADIYDETGRLQEAEALYLKSTQNRPTDWYGFLALGIFYYQHERYADAEAALNQAKALTPDNELVRQDLAGIYRQHGRYTEAVAEYQQALRIHSTADLYAGLGGAYFYQHRYQDAVSAVEAAIDMSGNNYRYWGNLGIYSKWAPGNESKSAPALRRAIELATKVSETSKSDLSVHANLAEYRARLGDEKGALAEIERIPASARGQFTTRIALAYELTGHRDRAIAAIRANLKSPASLSQIKDDPDLAAVWREGKF
jgi:tetratricopeptide (TPR) repeat protein